MWHWLRQTRRNRLVALFPRPGRVRVPLRDPPGAAARAPDLAALCRAAVAYLEKRGVELSEFCSKVMDVQVMNNLKEAPLSPISNTRKNFFYI